MIKFRGDRAWHCQPFGMSVEDMLWVIGQGIEVCQQTGIQPRVDLQTLSMRFRDGDGQRVKVRWLIFQIGRPYFPTRAIVSVATTTDLDNQRVKAGGRSTVDKGSYFLGARKCVADHPKGSYLIRFNRWLTLRYRRKRHEDGQDRQGSTPKPRDVGSVFS